MDLILLYNNEHLKKISDSPLLLQELAESIIQENLQEEAENTILFQKQTQARNKLHDVQYITKRIKQEFIHIFLAAFQSTIGYNKAFFEIFDMSFMVK